ncbi:MAG: c-type cytochrome [Nitrospinaceae bacterium]
MPGDDVVAMHQGSPHGGQFERHQLHHGMGRGGRGICPQIRVTPQAPGQVYNSKNPLAPTPENLAEGRSLFHYKAQPTVCKVCHGANGNGMGMMAQGLNPMPRNFTCKETMDKVSDGQMFWIIKNGTPSAAMPPFQLFLNEKQIWQLILYIRTLSYEEPGFLP